MRWGGRWNCCCSAPLPAEGGDEGAETGEDPAAVTSPLLVDSCGQVDDERRSSGTSAPHIDGSQLDLGRRGWILSSRVARLGRRGEGGVVAAPPHLVRRRPAIMRCWGGGEDDAAATQSPPSTA